MLTQADLHSKLNYSPETGIFTRKTKTWKSQVGDIVGSKCNNYLYIHVSGKMYYAHRLAWFYVYGYFPKVIDHINGNPHDNRLCNLREATLSQNQHNSIIPKNNTSGIKGVYWNKHAQKWMARVNVNYKCIYLGTFKNIEDAQKAVMDARKEHHGIFAKD